MKKIPLTNGGHVKVDDADFEWLIQWKWRWQKSKSGKKYAVRSLGRGSVLMHKALFPEVKELDHKNLDGLDNQRQNLRPATRSQNQANRPATSRNSSGFKGVDRHYQFWRARIMVNRKHLFLGQFLEKIEAAKAYDAAALLYFGKFARLNFPAIQPA